MMFGGRRFQWDFLLAAVAFPIIGSDFMSHFNLVLDFAGGVLSSSPGTFRQGTSDDILFRAIIQPAFLN
jgi:hypothetical protein